MLQLIPGLIVYSNVIDSQNAERVSNYAATVVGWVICSVFSYGKRI